MHERTVNVLRVFRDQETGFPSDFGFEQTKCNSVHHAELVAAINDATQPGANPPDLVLLHVPPDSDDVAVLAHFGLLTVVVDPRERYRDFTEADFATDKVQRIPMGTQLRYLALLRQRLATA